MYFFLIALFFYSISSQTCNSILDSVGYSTTLQCELLAKNASDACSCIQNYYDGAAKNCDGTTLAVDVSCAVATIKSAVTKGSDFGESCSICKEPPASPNWPTACSQCYMKYTSCLTTGTYDLIAADSIASSISLKSICGCLGSFIDCFGSCSSPLSSYVNDIGCSVYGFCSCDGDKSVADGTAVVSYLRTTSFGTFHASLTSVSQGAILTVDCATKTTSGVSGDRFICDINFSSDNPNWPDVHLWIEAFIGRSVKIVAGSVATGDIGTVVLKRDVNEAAVTGTYTIAVDSNGANGIKGFFALLIFTVLFMMF